MSIKLKLKFKNLNLKKKQQMKNNSSENIISFNASFNLKMKCKLRKIFLKLLNKHFAKNSKFHKIINRNTFKLCYCCSSNLETIAKIQNARKFKANVQKVIINSETCNCRYKGKCPLHGVCKNEWCNLQSRSK